jgi:hypothetical protein
MLGDLLCGDRQLFKMLMNDGYKTKNKSSEIDDDKKAGKVGKGGMERVQKMIERKTQSDDGMRGGEKTEKNEGKKRKRGTTDKKDGRTETP